MPVTVGLSAVLPRPLTCIVNPEPATTSAVGATVRLGRTVTAMGAPATRVKDLSAGTPATRVFKFHIKKHSVACALTGPGHAPTHRFNAARYTALRSKSQDEDEGIRDE